MPRLVEIVKMIEIISRLVSCRVSGYRVGYGTKLKNTHYKIKINLPFSHCLQS